jgi:cyclomaltodextrinase / maltogenic alpha-amylase / neopullulanase
MSTFTPDWARQVVWYQIFPERFHNGDPHNDSDLQDLRGAWPHDLTQPWQIHPWTSDWYALQPFEKAHRNRDIWFHLQRRRYGGDLQGIIDKLDYLQDLGVSALYLNPVFTSPSSHKYDGASYHHVDPNLGPDPLADRLLIMQEDPGDPLTWVWTSADKLLLTLISAVHDRGMYIILDGVFNHVGLNFWAFRDVVEKQQKSAYKDWFKIKSWRNENKRQKFDYQGWFGVKELPEWRQDANGIVDGPRQYIFNATRRWMDPHANGDIQRGIDGWRLDVAFCIAHPFWKEWRTLVKSINPQAYLTAEIIDPIPVLKPYLEGDEFDAVMNYNFSFCCAEYFIDQKKRIKTSEFDRLLAELRQAFPACVAPVMQNLYNSHDSPRLSTLIANPDAVAYRQWGRYYEWSHASNPRYRSDRPGARERQILKLMVIFQMTYIGSPMIYYGDEAGMWGANDPCCRRPMVWPDAPHDPARDRADGTVLTDAAPVEFDRDLYEHYRRLVHLRNQLPALQRGDFQTCLADDAKQVFVFSREYAGEKIIVALNNSAETQSCQITLTGTVQDVLNDTEGTRQTVSDFARLTIPAHWARILTLR